MKRSKKKWGDVAKPSGALGLTCYVLPGDVPNLRPASATRAWMDATQDGYAYRCLPLAIGNSHAWEILNPVPFDATWNGQTRGGVEIRALDNRQPYATDHFGSGILTFHISALFRTAPGVNLYVCGPTNAPKHGIAPLTAVVETDWSAATFTMNWKFTAPGVPVRFEQDEPFCAFFPIARGLDRIEPRLASIEDGGADFDEYAAWSDQRATFLKDLPVADTEAHRRGWEKSYFQGRHPDGRRGPADHQTKLRLHPFVGSAAKDGG